jgi:hypothetical protein
VHARTPGTGTAGGQQTCNQAIKPSSATISTLFGLEYAIAAIACVSWGRVVCQAAIWYFHTAIRRGLRWTGDSAMIRLREDLLDGEHLPAAVRAWRAVRMWPRVALAGNRGDIGQLVSISLLGSCLHDLRLCNCSGGILYR